MRILTFPLALMPAVLCLTVLTGGCSTTSKMGAAASVVRTYAAPANATGYVWNQLLPQPPQSGGGMERLDMETVRGFQNLQGSPRWAQARSDASLDVMQIYGPIIGPDFTTAKRPDVVALLAYAGRQFSVASGEAKAAFPRPRPFLADPSLTVCVSDMPGGSSYPSGHAGWGWLSAQIMARLEPAKAGELLARGLDYGQSRVICGVHYPTDVVAGRLMGDAMLARLDNDPQYQTLWPPQKPPARMRARPCFERTVFFGSKAACINYETRKHCAPDRAFVTRK